LRINRCNNFVGLLIHSFIKESGIPRLPRGAVRSVALKLRLKTPGHCGNRAEP